MSTFTCVAISCDDVVMQPFNVYVCSFLSSFYSQELSGQSRLSSFPMLFRSSVRMRHAHMSFGLQELLFTASSYTRHFCHGIHCATRESIQCYETKCYAFMMLLFKFMGFCGFVTDGKQRNYNMLQKFADQGACIGREEA